MNEKHIEIYIKGKETTVPCERICDRAMIVTGTWLRVASVQDEAHVDGEVVPNPELFIEQLKQWHIKPDLFTFSQKITDPTPKYGYHMEWDNFAVIPITTYHDWVTNRIKKDVKENLRRAKKEGIVVREVEFDNKFVQDIKGLYDETPFRQGKPCWHYQKSFEEIEKIHGTYKERAEYIGAYFGEELVGFLKLVYTGTIAKTMHVISKQRYFQKRPTNALIAKAVELCEQKCITHFIYGEFRFPGKKKSSLAEFKKRNGFEEIPYPRYFVPLSAKGRLMLRLGLHQGIRSRIPAPVIHLLIELRSRFYSCVRLLKWKNRPGYQESSV